MESKMPWSAEWFGGFTGRSAGHVPDHLIVAEDQLAHDQARFWAFTDSLIPWNADVHFYAVDFHGPYTAAQIRDAMRGIAADYPPDGEENQRRYKELERRLTQAEDNPQQPTEEPMDEFEIDGNLLVARDKYGEERMYETSIEDRIHLAASLLKTLPEWAKRHVGEMVEEE